jgi:hypothetical protein
MIGMISSKSQVYNAIRNMFLSNLYYSVRAKLRNGEPDFDMASSFFLHCLYEKENGNPNAPEDGFLKGPLLVCVSLIFYASYMS